MECHASDELVGLGDQIALLAAHIHAANHRLLTLIAEFHRRSGWKDGDFRSCAHWLAWRTGIDLGAAREKVRAALALEALPEISRSMERGELSFAKVRALTRVATPENEPELLAYAQGSTAAQLEWLVRGWKRHDRLDEQEQERLRHRSRCFSVFTDDEGMYVVKGRLDPEVGALLMRAVDAASDFLFRGEGATSASAEQLGARNVEEETTPLQRRADAVGLIAERVLRAGFGATTSGSKAERYQVVLHVEPETLSATGEQGTSELEDGTRVSAETSRRIACDASLVKVTRGDDGSVLDVGQRTRTVPPAIRRALEVRDRGCRFPGCGLRYTDAHHVRHWADGGATRLDNLVLLCPKHHRTVHDGGYRMDYPPGGRPNFYDPRGLPLPELPPNPAHRLATTPDTTWTSPASRRIRRSGNRWLRSRASRVENSSSYGSIRSRWASASLGGYGVGHYSRTRSWAPRSSAI